jgi:hypothetical protein
MFAFTVFALLAILIAIAAAIDVIPTNSSAKDIRGPCYCYCQCCIHQGSSACALDPKVSLPQFYVNDCSECNKDNGAICGLKFPSSCPVGTLNPLDIRQGWCL